MNIKICKNCDKEKNTDKFYKQQQVGKNGQVWPYLDCYCKICRKNYAHERRRDIKRQAVEYLGRVCTDCKIQDENYAIYDFHHISGEKDFTISKANGKSFTSIKKELDKCILLCSNCHRKRHYK